MKSKEQPITDISALAVVAAKAQGGRMKLFDRTALANIPHTPENIADAIRAVKTTTAQVKVMLEMSTVQRGMYLCWLKTNYTQHGEWMKFCEKHFAEVPVRTRNYWMAAYLTAIGEKKPKALPVYDREELEEQEFTSAVESLNTSQGIAPRLALLDHIAKLEKNRDKGREQREGDREVIDVLRAEVESLKAGAAIPKHVKDETLRIEFVRNQFWSFVKFWLSSLPDNASRLKLHKALFTELTDEMMELWENHIFPQAESRIAKAKRKGK